MARRPPFPVLVNVAKTGDPALVGDAAVADVLACVQAVLPVADAVVDAPVVRASRMMSPRSTVRTYRLLSRPGARP